MKPSAARALRSTQVNTIAPAPSGAGIDVLAVTEDDFFLMAVRRVVTLPNRVWHATSESQAADMLLSSPCAVALIDLALVQGQLEQVITRLRQQFPDLGFVAAGEPEDQTRLTRFLHSGELQGFIAKADAAPFMDAVSAALVEQRQGTRPPQEDREAPRCVPNARPFTTLRIQDLELDVAALCVLDRRGWRRAIVPPAL